MKISKRAAQLFTEAMAQAPEQRLQFVSEQCGSDEALLDELTSLLGAAAKAGEFFSGMSEKVGLSALAEVESPLPANKTIGHWRLKSVIGRGGMGVVYRAERADEQFEQLAALKVLPFGLDTDAARSRFLTERQILARLEHANIARLLDGGVTDEGSPYFVMEYVDGVPIDSYCDERQLNIDERIRLFLGVLAAVSHAHAHLIVHRDIKPSNVLVTNDGNVKLLDFGIAKLLSGDGAVGDTREMGIALTPDFAAPEQLIGGSVTTTTDVYTLGLLLYTLLAGRNPRPLTGDNSLAALQAAVATNAPKLSDFATDPHRLSVGDANAVLTHRKTSITALRRTLRGDLDNIMQKALALDAEDRYSSVGDFAADLRRYLDDEAVTAQPVSVLYRVNKFVRRHRGGVLVASLALTALIASAVITTWQMVEARRQRDLAFDQQQRVQATNSFMELLFSQIGSDSNPLTPVELLDRGVELLDRQYGVEDRFAATTFYDVSNFYSTLGEDDKHLSLLDRAAEIARTHGDLEIVAATLCSRAQVTLYTDLESAHREVQEAMQILATTPARSPRPMINCYRSSGLVLAAQGDPAGAEAELRAALKIVDTSPIKLDQDRAALLSAIGEQYFDTDRPGEALELLDEALTIWDRIGFGGTVPAVIHRLNRAAVLMRMGEVLSAAEDQREALDRLERIGTPLLGSGAHYAGSLIRLARYEEALQLFTSELAAAQESGNARWVPRNEMQIGRTFARMGRIDEAEPYFVSAEAAYRLRPDSQQRMLNMISLARVDGLLLQGDAVRAAQAIDDILLDMGYPRSMDTPALSTALWTAARVALARGDNAAAETYASDSYDIVARLAREERLSADVGQALLLRARARLSLGNRF